MQMNPKWDFNEKSQLLLSIIGSNDSYVQNKEFERHFTEGLRKVSMEIIKGKLRSYIWTT